jgi:hypothetical protein
MDWEKNSTKKITTKKITKIVAKNKEDLFSKFPQLFLTTFFQEIKLLIFSSYFFRHNFLIFLIIFPSHLFAHFLLKSEIELRNLYSYLPVFTTIFTFLKLFLLSLLKIWRWLVSKFTSIRVQEFGSEKAAPTEEIKRLRWPKIIIINKII